MKKLSLLILFCLSLFANNSFYQNGNLVTLTPLKEARDINNNSVKYYQTQYGQKVGVTNQILLKCNNDVDCTKTLNKYSFQNITKLTTTIYLITIFNSEDVFEVSKKLYEDENIQFAHPNFLKEKKRR